MNNKAHIIAFYLPQFHTIPENDIWWGKGFTEWTNVGKAKPLFTGHYQPRVPADLGYYDLRVPEVREAQAQMATKYGISGFCYWHYWFGNGKKLLERPFQEVLKSGKPDYPFCLAWANQSWKGFSHGLTNRNILIEQQYPGTHDYEAHFYDVLRAFSDKRYMTIDDKPIFLIYQPHEFSEISIFIDQWNNLAIKNGLNGIFFIANSDKPGNIEKLLDMGFNAVNLNRLFQYQTLNRNFQQKICLYLKKKILKLPNCYNYKEVIHSFSGPEDDNYNVFPTIIPGWDHTPRSGLEGLIYHDSNPELFKIHVRQVIQRIKQKPDDRKFIFLKSWNEWAEGNYVEPDLKFGTKYLEVISECLNGDI